MKLKVLRPGRNILMVLLLSIILIGSKTSFATHYMGGEIRWECLPNGNFRFIAKLYRECGGIEYGNTIQLDNNVPVNLIDPAAANSITLNLYPDNNTGRTDLSPVCNWNSAYPHINCATVTGSNQGGVEEWLYTSDQAFPNGIMISGVPPVMGYTFSVSVCNRNDCSNIISAIGYCAFLKAVMYPYENQSVNPCFNSSPIFAVRPQAVVPAGLPITYNPTAYDLDGDSVVYSWAEPLQSLNQPITAYVPGFSYNNPLPGTTLNPANVPAVLDPFSGQLTFTSFTQGSYLTTYKVSEYRNGFRIGEIGREMQVVILTTNPNLNPVTTLPFPQNGNPYVDTVYFGSLVHFTFTSVDSGLLNNNIDPQTVKLDVKGSMMGTFGTCNCGCPVLPCAQLNMAVPTSSVTSLSVDFSWQTSVNHLLFGTTPKSIADYYFVFITSDDFCPVPAFTMVPVKIVIKDIILPPPVLSTYLVIAATQSIDLLWTPVTNDTTNSFRYYLIYYKNSVAADYQVIDTIFDINQSSYMHTGALGLSSYFWYKIVTVSGHAGPIKSDFSNIITNYFVGVAEQEQSGFSVTYQPGTGFIRLSNLPDDCNGSQFEIFNMLGQLVFHKDLGKVNDSEISFRLNVRPGILLYRLNSCKYVENGKVRIE